MSKLYRDRKNDDFEDFDSEPEILTEYYEDHYDHPQTGFKSLIKLLSQFLLL